MKFAVNYSAPLVRLLAEGAIQIDLIKIPDWEGMLEEASAFGDITIHFDLEVGLGNTFQADFSRIRTLMERTFTPHVNTHLVTPRQLNPDNPQEMDQINALWREEIQLMTGQLGPGAVALEHHPYTLANPNIRPAADPQVFSRVIQDTACMLLLDLAHARITADTLQVNVRDYIRAMPLDRLVEMHITGIKTHSGVLTDHFELGVEDWTTLTWALEQIRSGTWRPPEIIAFEYGGIGSTFVWRTNHDVLKSQVPVLYDMVRSGTEV
jgi:uncharacterized protein